MSAAEQNVSTIHRGLYQDHNGHVVQVIDTAWHTGIKQTYVLFKYVDDDQLLTLTVAEFQGKTVKAGQLVEKFSYLNTSQYTSSKTDS